MILTLMFSFEWPSVESHCFRRERTARVIQRPSKAKAAGHIQTAVLGFAMCYVPSVAMATFFPVFTSKLLLLLVLISTVIQCLANCLRELKFL